DLDTTKQEINRNFERLVKAELIYKDNDGYYDLTVYGNTICSQVPDFVFVSQNKKYFKNHNFGGIPIKFVQRIGALSMSQHVKGFSNVLEQWKSIYKNADQYIYEILSEVPLDTIKPVVEKIRKGIKFQYILSGSTIVPKGRKELLEKLGFKKLIEKGAVKRKMKDSVHVSVILNEKEAMIMFPNMDGEPDMREVFYSQDPLFHEWCLDYFRYCWYGSEIFLEHKLKE
ncbi:MAG: helix-turn-helix transcriptional regulator, partial [Nitrosotalea sp.]